MRTILTLFPNSPADHWGYRYATSPVRDSDVTVPSFAVLDSGMTQSYESGTYLPRLDLLALSIGLGAAMVGPSPFKMNMAYTGNHDHPNRSMSIIITPFKGAMFPLIDEHIKRAMDSAISSTIP